MGYLVKKKFYENADADGNRGIWETSCYCSNCHEEVTEDTLEYDEEENEYFCPECGELIGLDYEDAPDPDEEYDREFWGEDYED